MRLRLSVPPAHAASLEAHLVAQGFPPERIGCGRLEVLFPATPALFAAATELDLWEARGGSTEALLIEPTA